MSTKIFMRVFISLLVLSTFAFASIGRITALSGDVSIIRAAKTQKATPNFQLDEKDTIKSSAGATAQIMFNDKTVITVGSNTLFKVEEYAFGEKDAKARFSVGEGTFKSITGKIAKIAPEKFKVETKTATIGIRGTIFVGNVNNAGVLTVACTKGAITVTPNIPSAPPVIVNQGQMTKADNKGVEAPKAYTPNDMKNLEKSLTTDKKAQGGSNGGGTQQASAPTTDAETPKIASTTPLVNKEAIPASIANNINTVLNTATTQKATETVAEVIKKEEDKIVIAPPPPPPTVPATTTTVSADGGYAVLPQGYLSGYFRSYKYNSLTYTQDIALGYNTGLLTDATATWVTALNTRTSVDSGAWSSEVSSEESKTYTISPYTPSASYDGAPIIVNTASSSTIMDNKLETFAFLTIESGAGWNKTTYSFIGKPTKSTDFSSLVGKTYGYLPPESIGDFNVGDGVTVRYYADKGSVFKMVNGGSSFKVTVGTIVPNSYGSYFSGAFIDLPFPVLGSSQVMMGGLYGSEGQALIAHTLDSDPSKTSFKLGYREVGAYTPPVGTGTVNIEGFGASVYGDGTGATDAHTVSGTIDRSNGLVQADIGDYSFGSISDITKSVYIADNMLAATNGSNAVMFSAPDTSGGGGGTTSDYVSWGYWAVLDVDSAMAIHPLSTWVAGVPTPIGSMPPSGTESYDGRVIGGIRTMGGILQIDPSIGNAVHFDVDFGAANTVSGYMNFQSVGGGASSWSMDIPATAISGNSFSSTTLINKAGGNETVSWGRIQGKFYGPSANAIGGSFSAGAYSDNGAFGVFKANKTVSPP